MRRLLPLVALLLLAACFERDPSKIPNPDPNHTHADFAVWIDGVQIDFTNAKYMSGTSTDEDSHDEPDEHHHQYLHLHDGVEQVIHSHKPGQTLGAFFQSIGFLMKDTCFARDTGEIHCGMRMFVNGTEVSYDADYPFQDLDVILLTNASDAAEVLRQQQMLSDDACLYSKRCPWRGEPPAENCVADPAVPCVAE